MILTEPTVDAAELQARSGWTLRPEGLCRADACVPIPEEEREPSSSVGAGGGDDVAIVLRADRLAERLGAPLEHDAEHGLWALGPATGRRALDSARLPEIVLPDVRTGEPFDLRSLRGTRVLLIAWASW